MEEMQKKLEEAEQRVQSLEEEKDKKREKKKKKSSAKEEFEEEEIPEDLWEQQEYYQVRAKSRVSVLQHPEEKLQGVWRRKNSKTQQESSTILQSRLTIKSPQSPD